MNDTLIGALGALGSIFFFGSYAVFIRMPSVMAINVEPIVFQTYKVICLFRHQLACIAVCVFVSYIWGAYVFKEPIRNQLLALLALAVMTVGMIGITWATSGGGSPLGNLRKSWSIIVRFSRAKKAHGTLLGHAKDEDEITSLIVDTEGSPTKAVHESSGAKIDAEDRFFKGVLAAIIVGITNGSFMIPLEYANKDVVGVEYIISFGVGAIIMTGCVLAIHSAILFSHGKPLPQFHFSVAAFPALMTGLFWSAGNFCSTYATMYLGMSLGWPLVQCQLIISALWAAFYFKDVTDRKLVAGLLGSSLLVVFGAALLSRFGTYST
ncbi:unnamed protein product [Calypogeia fissa]